MKLGIGALLDAGHPLDAILDLTFDQIALATEAISRWKARQIEMVASPILGALGHKYRRGAVSGRRAPPNPVYAAGRAQGEQALILSLQMAGIPITRKSDTRQPTDE